MDAQELLRAGIAAIRDENDTARGRQLLQESLKLNPRNALAWIWLSRTTTDPQKRLQYIERALQIEPEHMQALALRKHLVGDDKAPAPLTSPTAVLEKVKTINDVLTPEESHRIETLLKEADDYLVFDDKSSALHVWLAVLKIVGDHETAFKQSVVLLWEQRRYEELGRLTQNAISAKSEAKWVYKTAFDLARYQQQHETADQLLIKTAGLASTTDNEVMNIFQRFYRARKLPLGLMALENAAQHRPDDQSLWMLIGDTKSRLGWSDLAQVDYEHVAEINPRSVMGKAAEKKLQNYVPKLSDTERSSMALAIREAIPFGVLFWFLAILDSGLQLVSVGILRWLGVILSLSGGYLLITATSSPYQRLWIRYFGKAADNESEETPTETKAQAEPHKTILDEEVRQVIAVIGVTLLVIAFVMVLRRSMGLLLDPVEPDLRAMEELLF